MVTLWPLSVTLLPRHRDHQTTSGIEKSLVKAPVTCVGALLMGGVKRNRFSEYEPNRFARWRGGELISFPYPWCARWKVSECDGCTYGHQHPVSQGCKVSARAAQRSETPMYVIAWSGRSPDGGVAGLTC